jgi:hypothetical protein
MSSAGSAPNRCLLGHRDPALMASGWSVTRDPLCLTAGYPSSLGLVRPTDSHRRSRRVSTRAFTWALAAVATVLASMVLTTTANATPKAPNVRPWLLTLSEMPVGWVDAASPPPGPGKCSTINDVSGQHPGSFGLASFTRGVTSGTDELFELIGGWRSRSVARNAFQRVADTVSKCHGYTLRSAGTTYPVTFKRVHLGSYGVKAQSFQALTSVGPLDVIDSFVLVLKGRAVLAVHYIIIKSSSSTISVSPGLKLIKKAVAKVRG